MLCTSAATLSGFEGQYLQRGVILHHEPTATLTVNDPQPLRQATEALQREFGWLVDYEDPPYFSSAEVKDVTNRVWRVNHPTAPPALGISGGSFTSEFPEASDVDQDQSLLTTVRKIVSDYNQTSNPGRFSVRVESHNRVSITGVEMGAEGGGFSAVRPVLDADVYMPQGKVRAAELLQNVCRQLSERSGYPVKAGGFPLNMFGQTVVDTKVSSSEPARNALLTLSAASRYSLLWALLWDPDEHCYFLNLAIATRLTSTADGTQHIMFIKAD